VEEWPSWVWQAISDGHDREQREKAYAWLAANDYSLFVVLNVIRAHKQASGSCPCPTHKSPDALFPSPAELERLWHRGRL
jgi:hypothetical protein